MANRDISLVARTGFGGSTGEYLRGRPGYPDELLQWLRQELVLDSSKTAVDLGAGTGKFTTLLIQTEANVIAVEPLDAMRAELVARLPEVCSIAGTAQSLDLRDGSCDVVVCAQAFHWFATHKALAEIHRILKRGGRLALVWNVRDESIDWVAAITEIITPYEGAAPRYHKGAWRRSFDGRLFSDLIETRFTHRHSGRPNQVIVDRFMSASVIAALPRAKKMSVADQLNHLIATHSALKNKENIVFPYQTHAFWCSRK